MSKLSHQLSNEALSRIHARKVDMIRISSTYLLCLVIISSLTQTGHACLNHLQAETAVASERMTLESTETEGIAEVITALPPAASSWNAEPYLVNFDSAQEKKIRKAVALMKQVIASREFRERVINHTYEGNKTFVDNLGLTNEQIYQRILEGAEKLYPKKNNTMDVELELYFQDTTTIGYTYPNTVRIWMNTKYFNKYTPVGVAGNLFHEWMHKLGFDHALNWSATRDYSVPYALGYLMQELTSKFSKQSK
jgi:hypothetical protein